MQNPPSVPQGQIPPRRPLGVVQQRALTIPLPTQTGSSQQSLNVPQQLLMASQQVQQHPAPVVGDQQFQTQQLQQGQMGATAGQQMAQANPIQGEVYTMADLQYLAVTQGR